VGPVEFEETEGSDVDVEDGKSGGIVLDTGRWTFEQRPVALVLIQHESVALGELVAQ
jgi:hypothetical protein